MEPPQNENLRDKKRSEWLETRLEMRMHHPQLRNAVAILADFVFDFMNPKLTGRVLILHGPNGCGKTMISKKINRIFRNNRMKIGPYHCEGDSENEPSTKIVESRFIHWPTAIDGIKQEQWMIFEQAITEYLVILDDIGAEHDPSGIGLEKLYLILNRRERMHTILTTNFPPEMWEAKFERRIASRLFRNTTHIDLSDVPDFNAV